LQEVAVKDGGWLVLARLWLSQAGVSSWSKRGAPRSLVCMLKLRVYLLNVPHRPADFVFGGQDDSECVVCLCGSCDCGSCAARAAFIMLSIRLMRVRAEPPHWITGLVERWS
jgi:hypothetical protein